MKKICHQIPLFAIVALLSGTCGSCNKSAHQACPDNSSVLNWGKTPYSYGTWQLEEEGFNASSADGQTNLQTSCRWALYGAPLDANGLNPIRTYCISLPPDASVIFTWAYGSLGEFDFNQEWQGTTTEGIKMGDPLAKFQQIYPKFKVVSPGTRISTYLFPPSYPAVASDSTIWAYHSSHGDVYAQFTSSSPNGKLTALTLVQ